MKKILSVLFVVFSFGVFAQEPARLSLQSYGGNFIDQVVPKPVKTADGGFIICISSNSDSNTGNLDSFCVEHGDRSIFVKYNSDASVIEWSKCYENSGDSFVMYAFPTNDGGLVLGGMFKSAVGEGFWICKEDAAGNIVWRRNYSKGMGPLLRDMIATSDGGYMMTGVVYNTDTNFIVHGGDDIGIIMVDSLGNKVWSEAIGGSFNDECEHVIETSSGYYVLADEISDDFDCTGNHGNYDAYLVRLDKQGNIIWHRDLGGSGDDGAKGLADYGNGTVIVAGATNSQDGDISHPISLFDQFWMMQIDSNQNIVWDKCYGGGGGYCFPNSVCRALDGSIWTAGVSSSLGIGIDSAYGSTDAWILHTDSVGNFLNAKVLGSSGQDWAYIIHPLSNGAVLTGGYYEAHDRSFESIDSFGYIDAFLAVFAPWATSVPQISPTENYIKVYPNPATDVVNISSVKGFVATEIYSSVGLLMWKAVKAENAQVKVADWPRGVYYVQMTDENAFRITKKLVVL